MTAASLAGRRASVLWLTYGMPWPVDCGAALRYHQLLRRVAARHRVSLCAVVDVAPTPEALAALAPWCERVDWVLARSTFGLGRLRDVGHHVVRRDPLATWAYCPREMESKLRRLMVTGAVDIVQVEHSFLAPYVQILSRGTARTILSFHNFAQAQYRTMLDMPAGVVARLAWRGKALCMRGWEARLAARFDRCLAVSPLEVEQLGAVIGRPITLIPNGVDTTSLRPLPPEPGHRLLFVGNLRYAPNADAVRFLVHEILPFVRRAFPDVQLGVVGDRPPGLLADCERSGVEIVGRVAELVPHYRRAQVALAPLRAGGGTRLKILEAMALGRPVVATARGCEGLAMTPGEHLLVANRAEELAAAIVRLLGDRPLRERLAGAARQRVERDHDWEPLGRRLLAVYDELLERDPGSMP